MALFHCVLRLGTALFAFPLHFSTALEWAGLFTCPSSRWIRSSAINERTVCTSSTDNETAIFWLLKERCAHSNSCARSFAGCAYLNLAALLCLVPQVQWHGQWRFSLANQWSAEFTRHVLVTVQFAWNLGRGGTKKSTRYCTQWKPPQKWAMLCRTMQWKSAIRLLNHLVLAEVLQLTAKPSPFSLFNWFLMDKINCSNPFPS